MFLHDVKCSIEECCRDNGEDLSVDAGRWRSERSASLAHFWKGFQRRRYGKKTRISAHGFWFTGLKSANLEPNEIVRIYGAGGRTRTDMSLTSPDFESGAYTNFATPAYAGKEIIRRESSGATASGGPENRSEVSGSLLYFWHERYRVLSRCELLFSPFRIVISRCSRNDSSSRSELMSALFSTTPIILAPIS